MWCVSRRAVCGIPANRCLAVLVVCLTALSPPCWSGDGGIGFAPPFSFSLSGTAPTDMVVGDFNGDGHQDIAVAMSGTDSGEGEVSIMLGTGHGLFRNESFAVPFSPRGIASGDFNHDGRADLAITAGNSGSSGVHILLGDGSGAVQPFSTSLALDFPAAIAVADLNGDGILDLAVANSGNPHGVTLHFGRGDGNFSNGVMVEEASNLRALDIELADLNGDGVPDLVVPQATFINRGAGRGVRSAALGGSQAVALGDLDGNGLIDIAALDATELKVWLGLGEGRFRLSTVSPLAGRPRCIRIGDFNRDGLPDVVISNSAAGRIEVLPGWGRGLFGPAQVFPVGVEPAPMVIGDWNEDLLPDIAVAERNRGEQPYLSVLLQYTGRPLQPARLAWGAELRY